MKSFFRFLVTKLLAWRARRFLKRHKVQVIAVTGSIGKTSAKQAIYTILSKHFKVYASPEGFNTPLGISLAILQESKSGFSSPLQWLKILKRAFFGKKEVYSKIVLEMGADHPGDIKRLTRIALPSIGVVTAVAPVHLEGGQFKDVYDIAREKNKLIENLPPNGAAILNEDDPLVRAMVTKAKRFTYGLEPSSMLQALALHATEKHLAFDARYKEEESHCVVPVLGLFQIYILLPAIAVGLQLGLTLTQCIEALQDFCLPPGRMNPIPGVNKSHIIDSSYNASPVAMSAALKLLGQLPAVRRVAALGTMNELGEMNKEAHLTLGREAGRVANIIIAVGAEASNIKKGALEAGMADDKIYTFFDSVEAGNFLKPMLQPKDIILVKGSQNRVRMEKLVKIIMAYPEKASELLCRQEKEWKKI